MRIASTDQSLEPPPDCVWCIVGVEDSGKGLTSEQLKLLFSRFKQANPKTDQYGGSGLGLYVSKKLVELHRGFIGAYLSTLALSRSDLTRSACRGRLGTRQRFDLPLRYSCLSCPSSRLLLSLAAASRPRTRSEASQAANELERPRPDRGDASSRVGQRDFAESYVFDRLAPTEGSRRRR